MRRLWLLIALILSSALALLQLYALENYLYWRYEWFDLPMHLLGGFAIGTFLVYLIDPLKRSYYAGLVALALIGWEVFEYIFGIPRDTNYAFDTTVDLVAGSATAGIVYVIAKQTIWRSN